MKGRSKHAANPEIGAVQRDELDTMLTIMCESFDMPFAPARKIFLNDPYFSLQNKRVFRVGGKVASCLTIFPVACWIGHSIVQLAGIAGVATKRELRGKGYARRLLEETVLSLREQRMPFALLMPFSDGWYRRSGFEYAASAITCRLPRESLPILSHPARVRLMIAADIESVSAIYEHCSRGRSLSCIRDRKRWEYIINNIRLKVASISPTGTIEGYLFYEIRLGRVTQIVPRVEERPAIRVLEMHATTPDAQSQLLGYLAEQADSEAIYFEIPADERDETGLHDLAKSLPDACEVLPSSTLMARIVCFPALLEQLLPNWSGFNGQVTFECRDETFGFSDCLTLHGSGHGLPALETASADTGCSGLLISGTADKWASVVTGLISLQDACRQNLLMASSDAALEFASLLFPSRAPFLSPPDAF